MKEARKLYQVETGYIREFDVLNEFTAKVIDSYGDEAEGTFLIIQPSKCSYNNWLPEIISSRSIVTAEHPQSVYFLDTIFTATMEDAKILCELKIKDKLKFYERRQEDLSN